MDVSASRIAIAATSDPKSVASRVEKTEHRESDSIFMRQWQWFFRTMWGKAVDDLVKDNASDRSSPTCGKSYPDGRSLLHQRQNVYY